MNAAQRAAQWINDQRLRRGGIHELFDVDPQPDADGSTKFLEELSAELLRERFPRKFLTGGAKPLAGPSSPGFPGENHPCHGRPDTKEIA